MNIQKILTTASAYFNVSKSQLVGKLRMGEIVEARHIAMYVAHDSGISCPEIGRAFRRSRATVLHAVRKTQEYIRSDALIRQHVKQLSARVRLPDSAVPVDFLGGPFAGLALDARVPVVVALLSPLNPVGFESPYLRLAWCGQVLEPNRTVTRYSVQQEHSRVTLAVGLHNDVTGFEDHVHIDVSRILVGGVESGFVLCCCVDGFVHEMGLEELFTGFDPGATPASVADQPGVFMKP